MAQYHSGWSADDMEKLCQSLYEADTKGVFKWTECWKVLKENPKWLDYANKMMGKRSRSNEGSTSRTQAPSSDSPFNESAPIDLTSDTSTPSLNLDGPASRDVERPIGIKSAKVNNQRQRRIRQHSKSQASVSQSLTAGMMSLESASSIRWEMLAEADRTRDLKDDERYNDMKRMQAVEF